jgi:small-conductance mechanosensitive channel
VIELLRGVATAHAGIIASPEPLALFTGFGDSALNFQLRAWTDRHDSWGAVQSDLYVAVYKALSDAGIPIPFPQHDVHMDSAAPLAVHLVDGGGSGKRRASRSRYPPYATPSAARRYSLHYAWSAFHAGVVSSGILG